MPEFPLHFRDFSPTLDNDDETFVENVIFLIQTHRRNVTSTSREAENICSEGKDGCDDLPHTDRSISSRADN